MLAYDKYRYGFGNQFIQECTLEDIFQKADIVSLHIPLSHETLGWVSTPFFNAFSKPIYFCNIARGELVHLEALVEALQNGKILGACLDVLENEKLSTLTPTQQATFQTLVEHPSVLITPHIAGWTFESYKKINEVLRDKIKRYLDSRPIKQ